MIQTNKYCCFFILIFFLLITPTYMVNATLPPGSYGELKSEASEYIEIKILSVETKNVDSCMMEIIYAAKVMEVYRSNSNLQVGGEIAIYSWNIKNNPYCAGGGPRVPELLYVGWIGKTYLNPVENIDNSFNIAAYAESFQNIDQGKSRIK